MILFSNLLAINRLFLLFSFLLLALPSWAAAPFKFDLSSKAAILINEETGSVLYEKNAHQLFYPASITKVITALYALEKKGDSLDAVVVASHDAVATVHPHIRRAADKKHPPYRLEFGGTHIGIRVGEALTLKTLLYGLMLASGNDAANVIAEYVSGSVAQFMVELNAFVQTKGCQQTVLSTPHGMPTPDHVVTAYEMAQLTRYALQYPLFREIVKTTHYPRPQTNKQPESVLYQHNALVKPGKPFYYPKATGVKTGYTTASGYTLVASAENGERQLIAVLLGCEHLQDRYKDAIALFEAAFNEPKVSRTLFSKEFDTFSCPLKGAVKPVQAALSTDVVLSYYASEEPQFQTAVEWDSLSFPIQSETVVGQVRVTTDAGAVLVCAPLFSTQLIEATLGYKLECLWREAKTKMSKSMGLWMAALGFGIIGLAFYRYERRSA